MKKLLFLMVVIIYPIILLGQLGDGLTPATGYYGNITSARTWTTAYNGGIIYVGQNATGRYDLTIGNGGSLTISAGVTVIFCTIASDLIISGTGSLNAVGNNSNAITFTKLPSNPSWGHISFEGSSGSSVLSFCTVQNGAKSSALIEGYGGGIHINSNNVLISNCLIHNNSGVWGGGIFVNKNATPTIRNCKIYSNTATAGGGGLYFWNGSSSSVSNCVIYNNTCTGSYGGGGVFFGPLVGNTLFFNCDVVSNISTVNLGNNVLFYGNTVSPRPKLYNTIVWGSNNSIKYSSGQTSSIDDFTFCAIQGYTTGYTSCINLSGNNVDPTGPNFADPTNQNYAITSLSPCRNAGTSTGAPTTDILGNSRNLPYDIGAYEFISITWKLNAATTDWTNTANWDGGVPNGTSDVFIPSGATNYPISTPAPNFTLNLGNNMTLAPGAKVTLNTFTNNGSLNLQADATSGSASLIVNSYSGNNATIELFLTGGNPGAPTLKLNKWHFISTPVPSLPVSTFAPTYTLNVVGWYDNQVSGSLATGWIAYDGYRYSTGATGGPTFSNLTPGIGYDFFAATDRKYTFSGNLNTSDVPVTLSYSVNDALHGFNLLGNPFSSGLNWDDIVNNVYFPYPASTSKSLYFTRDNAQCSYISGVGIPSDVTGIIPPMQGFFVKTSGAGNSITIPASARVQGNIHSRYKGVEIIPLIRLSLAEDTLHDETVVRFDAGAKSGFDYDFDAPKMFLSPDILSIYSTFDGSNFAINGLPFPDSLVAVPIVVNLLANGNNTITATQLQGLDKYDVTLTDNTTGFVANLKTTPVLTFTGTKGTTANRFVLKVVAIATGIENPVVLKNIFNIYPVNSMINIQTLSDKWEGKTGYVRVMDLTGRTVGDLKNSEFYKNSLIRIAAPGAKGIYMVEITSGVLRYVGKVVIR